MAEGQETNTVNEAVTYVLRLRDLEAQAFRTGRTLAKHSEQLAAIGEQQHTAVGNMGPLRNAIGTPGGHTIGGQLDAIEQRLGTIEHFLSALARTHGVDPETID